MIIIIKYKEYKYITYNNILMLYLLFLLPFVINGFLHNNNFNVIKTNNKLYLLNDKDNVKLCNTTLAKTDKILNIIPGVGLGIPLNLLSYYYTTNHYGYSIITLKMVLLQFLLGIFTYGYDRYRDALEYEKGQFDTIKKEQYENYLNHKEYYEKLFKSVLNIITLSLLDDTNTNVIDSIICYYFYEINKKNYITYILNKVLLIDGKYINVVIPKIIFLFLLYEFHLLQYLPFLIVLETTKYYTILKKTNGLAKSFYVSFMWILSIIILPCVEHDKNYSILLYPKDYLLPYLLIFISTNIADVKDIEEDKINNIQTIPVRYGKKNTLIFCSILSIMYIYLCLS